MPEPLVALARRALALVAARQPNAYASIAARLADLSLSLVAESDELWLVGREGQLVEETAAGRQASVRVSTSKRAVTALVAGHVTLLEALRSGAVELAGTTSALQRCTQGFEYFVGALLRIDDAAALRAALEEEGCDAND